MDEAGYELDEERQRFVLASAKAVASEGIIHVEPGHLAEIPGPGNFRSILSDATAAARRRSGSLGEVELLASIKSLRLDGETMHLFWRSLAGFSRYGDLMEDAWRAAGKWAFIHYEGDMAEPLGWSDGLDPFEDD